MSGFFKETFDREFCIIVARVVVVVAAVSLASRVIAGR